jgi:hypothetical protein
MTTAKARADAWQSVRFAAGMTIMGSVFVVVQTLLFMEETLTEWQVPAITRRRTLDAT